jgi:hypothetical protein
MAELTKLASLPGLRSSTHSWWRLALRYCMEVRVSPTSIPPAATALAGVAAHHVEDRTTR